MPKLVKYETPLEIITGDYWQQTVDITSAANYTNWRAQWRPGFDHPVAIDLDISVSGTKITMSAQPDKTRKMGGEGVIDLEAEPGPRTFIRFETIGEKDVTRVG
jgi:hypothetical protein